MSGFSAIDLAKLPSPNIIESLDYETILQGMLEGLLQRDESFSALLESDPAYKILEVAAYRELLLRARVNDGARGVMLAYATGADLENLAAFFGVERQLITPEDKEAIPPVDAIYETDDRLRKRVQLSLEGHSTAGPIGSYVFHALAASPLVKDVDVSSPAPGKVSITILSTDGRGIPTTEVLDQVAEQLTAEHVRPLTDEVVVKAGAIIEYNVKAKLFLYEGPDAEVVRRQSQDAIDNYVYRHHLLGNDITLSGIYSALHQPGVQRVELTEPINTIVVENESAAWCKSVSLVVGGTDE